MSAAIPEEKTLNIARPTIIKTKKKKQAKEERIKIHERNHKGANTQIRPSLSENYENNKSARESWWRTYIRETPVPGSYAPESSDTFLLDLEKGCKTYSFKSDGRRLEAQRFGKGEYLLPGAYEHQDMLQKIQAKTPQNTYTFKNSGRGNKDILNEGIRDKNIDVSPNQYNVQDYLSLKTSEPKNKNFTFKSTTKRFPTIYFVPKEGPGPGLYNSKSRAGGAISSSFKSGTPRFKTSHNKIPGPGMYEPTFQNPQSKSLHKMGRLHGLFFSCSFQ